MLHIVISVNEAHRRSAAQVCLLNQTQFGHIQHKTREKPIEQMFIYVTPD